MSIEKAGGIWYKSIFLIRAYLILPEAVGNGAFGIKKRISYS